MGWHLRGVQMGTTRITIFSQQRIWNTETGFNDVLIHYNAFSGFSRKHEQDDRNTYVLFLSGDIDYVHSM